MLQAAYQILVATNPDDLHADVGDMWDSGKVQSYQSSQIIYAGKALASRTRYYWKVRVWNQSGQLSEYSEPTWWEMGLLQPEDWVGNWIEPEGGVPALSVTDEYETLRLPELSNVSPNLFRRRFEIKKEIKNCPGLCDRVGLLFAASQWQPGGRCEICTGLDQF